MMKVGALMLTEQALAWPVTSGDLIESRSPELVAVARAALTRYHDDALGEAE